MLINIVDTALLSHLSHASLIDEKTSNSSVNSASGDGILNRNSLRPRCRDVPELGLSAPAGSPRSSNDPNPHCIQVTPPLSMQSGQSNPSLIHRT